MLESRRLFPNEQSTRTTVAGRSLLEQIRLSLQWTEVKGAPTFDASLLRKKERDVKLLVRSASRPPALGVFGESQVGKSFLVSCFSGSSNHGILVRDPEWEAAHGISPDKPWAGKVQTLGGIPFLSHFNTEGGEESTGIICRFTQYPVDRPVTPDCFVGRVLSHADLLLSLAAGFLAVMAIDEDPQAFRPGLESEMMQLMQAPDEPAIGDESAELDYAWRLLREQYGKRAYISALMSTQFTELVNRLAGQNRRLVESSWYRLVGLMWNGRQNPVFTQLYQKLYQVLRSSGFPTVLEIPSRVVCGSESGSPITNVKLLDRVLEDSAAVDLWCRGDEDVSARPIRLSRPVISALLSELTLPVVPPADSDANTLLEEADVMDFPGARAEARNRASESEQSPAVETAVWVFRRGKLARLFSLLTERREITALCLAAPGHGNTEAPGVIRSLLDDWLELQRQAGGSGETLPLLFLAITKSDMLVNKGQAVSYATCPLGEKVLSVRAVYASGSGKTDWMDNWGGTRVPFQDVHWVCNALVPRFAVRTDDEQHLTRRKDVYLRDPTILRYVSDPLGKWTDLAETGGVRLLTQCIASRLRNTNKFARLRAEMREHARDLSGRLGEFYRSGQDIEEQQEAKEHARKHIAAIEQRWTRQRRNVLGDLLQTFRIDPEPVARMLDRLHSHTGRCDEDGFEISVDFDVFFRELQKIWAGLLDDRFKSERLIKRLGMDPAELQIMRWHWRDLTGQTWMEEAMRKTVHHYFRNPQGMQPFRRALVSAACWMWNRQVLELGQAPDQAPAVPIPPRLNDAKTPSWLWILRHWEKCLPEIYARNLAKGGPVPPGNDILARVLHGLRDWEANYAII